MTIETRAFGRYELRGLLGHGGFATVYRAFDPALEREVALKTLLPHLAAEQEIRGRFVAEARALAALHHPNIVTIYDVGEADGLPFFAMELIEGSTLAAWLGGGAPPLDRALLWLSNLASALDYLHAAGLVHRDVKPANIMIGPGGQAVLMDLGVARSLDATQHTQTGVSMGTPAYMSPEQVRGQPAGPAADLYALGILAFALLTGQAPFLGDTAAVLHAQVYDAPPLAGLPPVYAAALSTALAKEPALRPSSAANFLAALRGEPAPDATLPASAGFVTAPLPGYTPPFGAMPPPQPPRPPEPPRPPRGGLSARAGALLAGALVVIALLIAAIAVVLSHGSSPPTQAVNQRPSVIATVAGASTVAPAGRSAATAAASPAQTVPATGSASPSPAAPTAAPTSAMPFAATSIAIDSNGVSGWAAGGSALNAQVAFQNAPAGATLLLRIAPAGDPGHPVAQGAFTPLGASNGTVNLSAPAVGVVPAGNYVALIYNGDWTLAQSYSLAVAPSVAAPPAATQPPAANSPPTQALPAPPSLSYPAAGGSGPSPHIVAVTPENAASAGGAFSFTMVARNDGATSGSGSITASSPDATSMVATPLGCNAINVQPMNRAAGDKDTIFTVNGFYTGALTYPLAEIDFDALPAGAVCSLRVTVVPRASASTLRLYLRTTVFGAGQTIVTWPAVTGPGDQQNLPVVIWNVPLH